MAITGIDDELIASAYSAVPRRRMTTKTFGIYAAACLLLICCIALTLRFGTPKISVYGQTVTKTALTIEPERGAASTRQYDREGISIPITVKANTDFTIQASYGELELANGDGVATTGYSDFLNVSGSTDVIWFIEEPDISRTYELSINGGAEVFVLSYDRTSSSWQIAKK